MKNEPHWYAEVKRRIIAGDQTVAPTVDNMSHRDRITLRNELPADCPQPRNLWFDYRRQVWIEPVA